MLTCFFGTMHLGQEEKKLPTARHYLNDEACQCRKGRKLGDLSPRQRRNLGSKERTGEREGEKTRVWVNRGEKERRTPGCWSWKRPPPATAASRLLTAGSPLARGRARLALGLARPKVRGSGHAGADAEVSAVMCRGGLADWVLLCGALINVVFRGRMTVSDK